jgi:hypothetical protein
MEECRTSLGPCGSESLKSLCTQIEAQKCEWPSVHATVVGEGSYALPLRLSPSPHVRRISCVACGFARVLVDCAHGQSVARQWSQQIAGTGSTSQTGCRPWEARQRLPPSWKSQRDPRLREEVSERNARPRRCGVILKRLYQRSFVIGQNGCDPCFQTLVAALLDERETRRSALNPVRMTMSNACAHTLGRVG